MSPDDGDARIAAPLLVPARAPTKPGASDATIQTALARTGGMFPVNARKPAEGEAPATRLAADVLEADPRSAGSSPTGGDTARDALMPGVGGAAMSLGEGLAAGGAATFVTLAALSAFDELESATRSVLAPDIRDTFGMSDGAIVFLSAASGAFVLLGAAPMGWLAGRCRRSRMAGWAGIAFAAFVFACGLVANAFLLFLARLGVGVAKAGTMTVHGSLNAATYPIAVRGRLASAGATVGRLAAVLSPLAVGGIAALAGGDEGWRWVCLMLGIPAAVAACFVFRLPEPPRGEYGMKAVLGEVVEPAERAPVSPEAAFARLMRIRTSDLIDFLGLGRYADAFIGDLSTGTRRISTKSAANSAHHSSSSNTTCR